MAQIMKNEEVKFVNEIQTVSTALAVWCVDRIKKDDWSIEDCKLAILNAGKIAGRE